MYINLTFSLLWFSVALYFALFEGVGTTFAFCYLPALMFTRAISGYVLHGGWPDLTAANVTILAMIIGSLLRIGQGAKIRWGMMDLIVLFAPVASIISAITTEVWHTGYDEFIKQLFGWWVPYFVARYAFRSEAIRQKFLWTLATCLLLLTPFVLIELRLWPHFYAEMLKKTGIGISSDWRAEMRLGLFRTAISFNHSIYFGDACVSMIGMLLVLATTTKIGLRNWLVRLGIAAAVLGLAASLSFGPWGAAALAAAIFVLLRYFRSFRFLLAPTVILAIAVMTVVTWQLATAPLGERPRDGSVADSFWVRRLILQHTWEQATTAGPFGWGRLEPLDVVDLDSIDNAYILFAMCRGWVYLLLWLAIPLAVALRVGKAMRRYTASQAHIFPLAVGAACALGVSAAFYGVWAGWAGEPYTMLWLIGIALMMSVSDFCLEAPAPLANLDNRARGFEPIIARRFGGRPVANSPPRPRLPVGAR
ncbi:MAG TPA: hypothetical protein VFC78_20585 [Tepidisphaeraceae bacterium]|nr:hypothetical protein [Tepidisphaeraceae bacterium]